MVVWVLVAAVLGTARTPGPQAAHGRLYPQSCTTAQEMSIHGGGAGGGGGRSRQPYEGEGVCDAAGNLCKMEPGRVGQKPPYHL